MNQRKKERNAIISHIQQICIYMHANKLVHSKLQIYLIFYLL